MIINTIANISENKTRFEVVCVEKKVDDDDDEE